MIKAPIPVNEAERLETLYRLDILDTPPEERFDRITRIAKELFDVHIAAISLVDDVRVWLKSCVGTDQRQSRRETSFCGHAIVAEDILLVSDARQDPRFWDNPFVTGEPWLRFYAGCPLATPDGVRVGSLCLIDLRPRELTEKELQVLRDMGAWAARELSVIQTLEQSIITLRDSEARVQAILDNVIDGIFTIDSQGTIQSVNQVGERLFGYASSEIIGQNLLMLIPDDAHAVYESAFGVALEGLSGTGRPIALREVGGRKKDGSTFPMEMAICDMVLKRRRHFIVVARDISGRKAHIAMLEHQATHDALTDLPNRILLHDRLQQAILRGRRENEPVALLVMDINRFKEINAALGHDNGDILLQQFALRLRGLLRASDTVARLGGDDFAILLPKTDREGAIVLTRKVQKALEPPFALDRLSLDIAVSTGIVVYPEHGEDATRLIQHADVAMYCAKQTDTGYFVYAGEKDPNTPRRLALIGELRHAIAENELFLVYQPVIDLKTGRVSGVEALARWQHPEFGLIPPDEFIVLAEQTGLIKPLTQWVLQTAIEQVHQWDRTGLRLTMAVNLSSRNLQDPALPDQIGELLQAHGVSAQRMALEITEGTIMADPQRAMTILMRLGEMGLRLLIDDFGTGYSSLGYLQRLPVHGIKIDKSFVIGMAQSNNDEVIVRSTINLGHNLGLRIVAEGVENQQTLDRLIALGCDEAQGYHMSRPISPKDLEAWLAASQWGLQAR